MRDEAKAAAFKQRFGRRDTKFVKDRPLGPVDLRGNLIPSCASGPCPNDIDIHDWYVVGSHDHPHRVINRYKMNIDFVKKRKPRPAPKKVVEVEESDEEDDLKSLDIKERIKSKLRRRHAGRVRTGRIPDVKQTLRDRVKERLRDRKKGIRSSSKKESEGKSD